MRLISADVIIVGGGPAGAACARDLVKAGVDTLVLDKKSFPRTKICAGWLTPRVFDHLGVDPASYPWGLTRFDRLQFHFPGIRVPVRTRQYAIRRREFDHWMLSRSKARFQVHAVRHIRPEGQGYLIDNRFSARYLVGAGGTHCPVNRTFFAGPTPVPPQSLIVAMEAEFQTSIRNPDCHLWFFEDRLPGYAWYVPKQGGWVAVGVGAKQFRLERMGRTLPSYWQKLVTRLVREGFLASLPPAPRGHVYHLENRRAPLFRDRILIAGDSAGVSTRDMGEGICGAILTGRRAARAILTGNRDDYPGDIPVFSLPGILWPRIFGRR